MTTLSHAAAANDLTISVTPIFTTSLPYPIGIVIESEKLIVRGGIGTGMLYVDRGQDGTTAVVHALGTAISLGWSSGGGSISATDGTTTVDPATSIVFPAGTLADLGGGAAGVGLVFSVLTADVDINTPGFLNPGDAGVPVLNIPAGALFQVFILQTTIFDQACEVDLLIGTEPVIETATVASYSRVGIDTLVPSFGFTEPSFGAGGANDSVESYRNNVSRWALATDDIHVYASAFPAGPSPSTGALTVYAIIATPAS